MNKIEYNERLSQAIQNIRKAAATSAVNTFEVSADQDSISDAIIAGVDAAIVETCATIEKLLFDK